MSFPPGWWENNIDDVKDEDDDENEEERLSPRPASSFPLDLRDTLEAGCGDWSQNLA